MENKNKRWKIATLMLGFLALALILVHPSNNPQPTEEMIKLGNLEISNDNLANYIDTFGNKPFKLENLETGECVYVLYDRESLRYEPC